MTVNPKRVGSSFDDWLKEEGIYEEVMKVSKAKVKMYQMLHDNKITKDDIPIIYHDVCLGRDPEEVAKERGLYENIKNEC